MNKTREIIVTQTFNELGVQINLKTTPLVRCKDCIYNTLNTDGVPELWCYKHGIDIEEDDYCSYGEKKEQEHEQ